jgi:competence ComEA-like helix-hairpin-helix protein
MNPTADTRPGSQAVARQHAYVGVALLLVATHLAGTHNLWRKHALQPLRPDQLRLRIDPNRASAAELELLPRVGPRLAEKIIAYRQSVASQPAFRTPEDLDRVPGIGPGTVELLRPHLIFEPPEPAPLGQPDP